MKTFNQPYESLTPAIALQLLKHGNFRFINRIGLNYDHMESVFETKDGQHPFAAIVGCMDSRTSIELVFDQSFGDVFSIRVAGNVISSDVLGSLEYATEVAGSKLIVVLGHTSCGAIVGACDHVKLGHVTTLLAKIEPVFEQEKTITSNRTGSNIEFVNAIAKLNAKHSVSEIMRQSSIISELVHSGKVGIIPAMYDIATGKVQFFTEDALLWRDNEVPEGNELKELLNA